MSRKFKPIPWNEFPTSHEVITDTNCLAFALGIKKPMQKKHQYSLIMTQEPIAKTFLKKVKKLGFNPKNFKRIPNIQEEKEKGYVIRVYGFVPDETLDGETFYDFHVIRREPDGKWVHKPGFLFRACEISKIEWEWILKKYGNRFVSFAIR